MVLQSGLPALRHFPNAVVGIALGLGGQAILWKNLAGWPALVDVREACEAVQWALWVACLVILAFFLATYGLKMRRHWAVVLAEARHAARANFFSGPNIAMCMLGLGLPNDVASEDGRTGLLQAIWVFAFLFQLAVSMLIYHRWLYLLGQESASAPWLLSLIVWFLLVPLGASADIDEASGLPLTKMVFGVGAFFAVLIYPLILLGIYHGRTGAGEPALFLTLAPVSVAGLGLRALGAPTAAEALFGLALFLLFFWLRSGPKLLEAPKVLGTYWAYVFPLAALATLAVGVAADRQTRSANALAAVCAALAVTVLLAVFVRMCVHLVSVARGRGTWTDPVVAALDGGGATARWARSGDSDKDDGELRQAAGAIPKAGSAVAPEAEARGEAADVRTRLLQLEELVQTQQAALKTLGKQVACATVLAPGDPRK